MTAAACPPKDTVSECQCLSEMLVDLPAAAPSYHDSVLGCGGGMAECDRCGQA
jgi:hypothetical protein